jgi:hypothetical protein
MSKLIQVSSSFDSDGFSPVFLNTQAGGSVRMEEWDDRPFLVAQTTAAISKVLNGELLPAEELSIFAEAWNGRPVPLRHPQRDGIFVSANSPDILSEYNVGYFFNARAEAHKLGAKLRGEMWLDVQEIQEKGGAALTALERLEAGETIEVSTGYFCEVREGSGVYDGEEYNGIQFNLKPDHIALLPDQTGACVQILQGEDGETEYFNEAEGHAARHPVDTYDKHYGRKLAFERAVRNFAENKLVRKAFWSVYFAAGIRLPKK